MPDFLGASRGQVFTLDMAIGAIVFLFIATLSTLAWDNLNAQIASAEQRKDLEFAVFSSSESLLKTPGNPVFWDASNVSAMKSFGLATVSSDSGALAGSHVLNASKAVFFLQLLEENYSDAKRVLGAGAFEFGFSIKNKSKEIINLSCNPGCFCGVPCWKTLNYSTMPQSGVSDAAAVQRAAVLEYFDSAGNKRKQIVTVSVFVWSS